jgi:cation diffusion facilitator CzcD-associated flavoprotein CzcO
MVQRSPSYVLSLPSVDPAAERLRRFLPTNAAYSVLRWRNMLRALLLFQLSRHAPGLVKRLLRKALAAQLPAGYDVDTHFSPTYNPWDQRMCFVPDGDLLKAIRHGRASVVTDRIDRFTENGLRLASGAELEADIIVTATGLNLSPMGGVSLSIDGADVALPETVAYKGMMLSGVPNFVYTLGYTNASWTLKSDLVARYVCRLLEHMDARGYSVATPLAPKSSAVEPFIDLQSGYVKRSLDRLPKQGTSTPWRLHQNYPRDVLLLRHGPVDDEGIEFSTATAPRPAADTPAA